MKAAGLLQAERGQRAHDRVAVRDRGLGIRNDELEEIFLRLHHEARQLQHGAVQLASSFRPQQAFLGGKQYRSGRDVLFHSADGGKAN